MRKEIEQRTEHPEEEVERWFDYAKPGETENGVTWFNEPYHEEDVYFYLVEGSEADLLIDTGMGIRALRPLLDELRPAGKPLVVVNTHWHFDHIGGNSEFASVKVPAHPLEVEGIKKGWSREDLEKYWFFKLFNEQPGDFNSESFQIPGYLHVAPELADGWKIDLGGRVLTAIETPGHTEGSISFFDETNGLLFTSDLLYEGPLYAFEEESDPAKYLESLRKISELSINTIYPGHNHSSTREFPNLIEEAIELFQRAKDKATPDKKGEEFPDTVEFLHPDFKEGRRLKVIVHENYVTR